MNKSAEKHLAAAKEYVAKGETFYRKAAEEIVAAQEADPTLGYREIGTWFERNESWVREIVRWHTSAVDHAPFGGPRQDAAQSKSRAKKFVREATPEQIAEVLADPDIRAKVSARDRGTAAAGRRLGVGTSGTARIVFATGNTQGGRRGNTDLRPVPDHGRVDQSAG